jgi:excinuclease UvrABC ATPase subunit
MSKRIYERCPVCKGMGIKSIPDDQESSDDEVNNLCRACMGQKGYWVDIWE